MATTKHEGLLHITVGALPMTQANLDLSHEIRLLKSAMLYADIVVFCSVSTALISALISLQPLNGKKLLELFAQTMKNDELDRLIGVYKLFEREKRLRERKKAEYEQIEEQIKRFEQDARNYFQALVTKTRFDEVRDAVNTGLVGLQLFRGATSDEVAREYVQFIGKAVLDGNTYPLFDAGTGRLVESAIREGKLVPPVTSVKRAKQVALSADLLSRLPLFEDAPIDEIVDIRKELDKPLVRFRSAIIQFSRDVQSASWNHEFPMEVEQVFRQHIEPAVLEIEDTCKSNKLILRLIPDLVNKSIVPVATSALGLLLAEATQLPSIVTSGLGLAAGVAATSLSSVQAWREKNQQIESNQLYFYYKAGKRLSK